MLRKLQLSISIIIGLFLFIPDNLKSINTYITYSESDLPDDNFQDLYIELHEPELNFDGLKEALTGFEAIVRSSEKVNTEILTFIDYSKPSTEKRLFVIDLKNKMVVYKTYVAHGKNTGQNFAESFSNQCQSHKSSLGFYITKNTYKGKHGYSLRLQGLEDGINDNALKRALVIHPAAYVSEEYIEKYGRLGRSFGCPAIPLENHQYLIDLIKNNTCLFVYFPDHNYLASSEYIH